MVMADMQKENNIGSHKRQGKTWLRRNYPHEKAARPLEEQLGDTNPLNLANKVT